MAPHDRAGARRNRHLRSDALGRRAGGNGLVADVTYSAPDNVSGTVSSEQWVIAQKPLPLPLGAVDLALTATASASYTSPWTTVSAINNGIYSIQSSDDNDLTPPGSPIWAKGGVIG